MQENEEKYDTPTRNKVKFKNIYHERQRQKKVSPSHLNTIRKIIENAIKQIVQESNQGGRKLFFIFPFFCFFFIGTIVFQEKVQFSVCEKLETKIKRMRKKLMVCLSRVNDYYSFFSLFPVELSTRRDYQSILKADRKEVCVC